MANRAPGEGQARGVRLAGQAIWISTQEAPGAAFPVVRIRIVELLRRLTGSFRDEQIDTDVLVSTGRVDDSGGVEMTVVLTNGDRLRQVLIFQGQLSRSDEGPVIAGTYIGVHPRESGTFTMRLERASA